MAQEGTGNKELRDTLRSMYEESRTGVLEITGDEGTVKVHLKEGKIVHALPPPGSDWLLGHVLIESGSIPERKLYRILRKHRRTGRPLENLLIEQGTLTRDVLSKLLDLQLRETILPLFQQIDLHCDFRDEPPQVNDFIRAVPIPFLLKEVDRRAKEWPGLRRLGIHRDQVYDKTEESLGRFLAPGGEEDAGGVGGHLGAAERVVYYYVNGRKTVGQVAFASFLGEFETIRAVHLLKRRQFVVLKERKGAGEQHEDPTILPKLVGLAYYLMLAALVASLVILRPAALELVEGLVSGDIAARSTPVVQAQDARVRAAVEIYFAQHGAYPETLIHLAEAGLLTDAESTRASRHIDYHPMDEGYRFERLDAPSAAAPEPNTDEPKTEPATETEPATGPETEPTPEPDTKAATETAAPPASE